MNKDQIVEHVREMVMNDPDVQKYVTDLAISYVEKFERALKEPIRTEVRDEMICQYQLMEYQHILNGVV